MRQEASQYTAWDGMTPEARLPILRGVFSDEDDQRKLHALSNQTSAQIRGLNWVLIERASWRGDHFVVPTKADPTLSQSRPKPEQILTPIADD